MSLVCKSLLPDVVCRSILKNIVASNHDTLDDWKRLLALLQVCRQWRELAIPLVYRYGYITVSKKPGIRSSISMDGVNMDNVNITTNMHLLHTQPHLKHLKVHVDYKTGLYSHIENMADLFKEYYSLDVSLLEYNVPALHSAKGYSKTLCFTLLVLWFAATIAMLFSV
ncbi:hypothetical protein LPJ55_004999 [Coemansia sp. RSA 990]|nr:hypothetical protein BX667DRAFT_223637 [Coemansia mojavensis]KAI9469372.1 hypothetical protein BX667DRAFT_140484 [Coemansia mojavensis]KAJ1869963.1 hypothetical protein LPJ55_004999 [Coemansia sp. RSA 990]